jgi:hypothetical protein
VRHDAQRIFVLQMLRHGLVATSEVSEDQIETALCLYFRLHQQEFMNCGKQAQYLISLYAMGVDTRIERILVELGHTLSQHFATAKSLHEQPAPGDERFVLVVASPLKTGEACKVLLMPLSYGFR